VSTFEETTNEVKRQMGSRSAAMTVPAPRTVTLHNNELSHLWGEGRPSGAICVGIRSIGVLAKDSIVRAAIEELTSDSVTDHLAEPQERFEELRVRLFVSRSMCDPNDVGSAHPLFPAPDLQVPRYLTEQAIKRLFDECERLAVETSPIMPEITDEDLELLALSLNSETLSSLEPFRAARARRWLWLVLDEIKNSIV